MTKQQAGKLGGLATLARHGAQHMAIIGKRGAAVTWKKYRLQPYGQSGYMLVDRETGIIKAIRGK